MHKEITVKIKKLPLLSTILNKKNLYTPKLLSKNIVKPVHSLLCLESNMFLYYTYSVGAKISHC